MFEYIKLIFLTFKINILKLPNKGIFSHNINQYFFIIMFDNIILSFINIIS